MGPAGCVQRAVATKSGCPAAPRSDADHLLNLLPRASDGPRPADRWERVRGVSLGLKTGTSTRRRVHQRSGKAVGRSTVDRSIYHGSRRHPSGSRHQCWSPAAHERHRGRVQELRGSWTQPRRRMLTLPLPSRGSLVCRPDAARRGLEHLEAAGSGRYGWTQDCAVAEVLAKRTVATATDQPTPVTRSPQYVGRMEYLGLDLVPWSGRAAGDPGHWDRAKVSWS